MAAPTQLKEEIIEELVTLAREEVQDSKVIPWIIERSPTWRNKGYSELKKSIEEANIDLQ